MSPLVQSTSPVHWSSPVIVDRRTEVAIGGAEVAIGDAEVAMGDAKLLLAVKVEKRLSGPL